MRLLLRDHQSPGDVLMLTAAVRDLHRAYPDRYRIAVDTTCMGLWENNPRVVPLATLGTPDRIVDCAAPAVDRANKRPVHFTRGFAEDLEIQLGVRIGAGELRGEVYLSETEKMLPSPPAEAGHAGPYWVVMAGGKYDFTTKWWNPDSYQAVVDHFAGRIQFVQCGERGHWHPPLKNVINLVGRTDVRQFVRTVYHADGVLCPITFAMHLSAAVPPRPGAPPLKPCVVIAGGREPPHWEMYPNHQFLHTIGALDCCATGGCWKGRCQPTGDPRDNEANLCLRPVTIRDRLRIGKCMAMITPDQVIKAVETYYDGGILRYPDEQVASPAAMAERGKARPEIRVHPSGLAVTIGVGPHAELARLAAREVRTRTGLETVVLGDDAFAASGLEHPHFLKFRLFDLVEASDLLYFDADVVCLENWDPASLFGGGEVVAVRERTVDEVREESERWGVPLEQHFNSGMMILNRQRDREWLRLAESIRFLHPTTLFDQLPLNAARHRSGVPIRFVDRRYNWIGFGESSLSHELPVVMAHKLAPRRCDLNVAYFEGAYELLPPGITLNEREGRWLAGKTFTFNNHGAPREIRLRQDGTIVPAALPHEVGYWFVHDVKGRPTLALASQTRIVHELIQEQDGLWRSANARDDVRLVERAHGCGIEITEENARVAADRFVQTAPAWPGDRFHGRGIVICGGGERYFPSAWVCIRMLRHLGCRLPIELWQLWASELSGPVRRLVERFDVRCADASEIRQRHPARILNGWELKPFAIMHSRFEEVLYLDADNVAIRDPTFLFDASPYQEFGAVFWPDIERLSGDRRIWDVCRVPYRDEPEFETGQILVNKRKCWTPIQLTMHLNEHSDFYYQYIHGDKETFHMAWRMLGREYAMVERPVHTLSAAMCQHDFSGRRLFQHRNLAKWRVRGGNRRVEGFELEDVCLRFIDELQPFWRAQPREGAVIAPVVW